MTGAAKYITQFDSSTSMLYALGNALKGRGFEGAGVVPTGLGFVPSLLNFLPFRFRQGIYRWSGGWNALDPRRLKTIRQEKISEWVVSQYPRRRYAAMMVGSSNGAAVHLAAAMGIPWLPQTFLVAVRRAVDPDDIEADIAWGRPAAQTVRKNNSDLKVNQMHDPVQDRLMVAQMAYFRLKRLRLGKIYERFIRERLMPGGTLIILDNRFLWPMVSVAQGHTFQVGGLGGLDPWDYLHGNPVVEAFLRSHHSSRKSWPLPGPVHEEPESEWGFHPALGEDTERFARAGGYRVQRIVFHEPEALSPWTADFYRWWYGKNGIGTRRLLVECFALIEPWLALQTGSVPFWLAFNAEPSFRAIEAYLRSGEAFDEIYLTLMSNGVEGIAQVTIERWKTILDRARNRGEFLGVNEQKYPLDFNSFTHYHAELKRKMQCRPDPLPPATLSEINRFMLESKKPHQIRWE